jgi:hypothetical protein
LQGARLPGNALSLFERSHLLAEGEQPIAERLLLPHHRTYLAQDVFVLVVSRRNVIAPCTRISSRQERISVRNSRISSSSRWS